MAIELRALKGDDLFALLPIFDKLDIIEELETIFTGSEYKKLDVKGKKEAEIKRMTEEIGVKLTTRLIKKLLKNISLVRDDVNALLANLSGKTVQEIVDLSLMDYVSAIKSIFKDPQFTDFFTSIVS